MISCNTQTRVSSPRIEKGVLIFTLQPFLKVTITLYPVVILSDRIVQPRIIHLYRYILRLDCQGQNEDMHGCNTQSRIIFANGVVLMCGEAPANSAIEVPRRIWKFSRTISWINDSFSVLSPSHVLAARREIPTRRLNDNP